MITNKLRFVETQPQSLAERKRALRAYMKARRGENENRDIKENRLIENFLVVLADLLADKQGITGFIYLSRSSEAPTDKLIEICQNKGVEVYSPRVESGEMLAVRYGEDFTLSDLGIREPTGEPCLEALHFAIVPLLAVDGQGNRLGYGGGYYDEYLRKHAGTVRIGYCFDFQVLGEVPFAETDEPLDILVTDKRVLYIKEKNGEHRKNTK